MKISNSKKQLAEIIHANGGWRELAESAAQCIGGEISFWHDAATKRHGEDWCGSYLGRCDDIEFTGVKLPNWHQTILSRDEYFHLYPVTETAPEPVVEAKPTIEQLAADYRNRKGYADRKQQEADAAKADAEAKLTELVAAGKAHGLVLSVACVKPELAITDWRDLQVGDLVECVRRPIGATCEPGMVGVVTLVDGEGVEAAFDGAMSCRAKGAWFSSEGECFRFTRRPAKGDTHA